MCSPICPHLVLYLSLTRVRNMLEVESVFKKVDVRGMWCVRLSQCEKKLKTKIFDFCAVRMDSEISWNIGEKNKNHEEIC
jgi:hypothetical protein